MVTSEKTPKPRRKFKIETREDVIRYMSEVVRSLRRLVVTDKDLDPIRITKQKTLVYALSHLAQQLSIAGMESASDDALRNEVLRRRELAGRPPAGPSPDGSASTETH